jgi:succinate-semialdehyde dehydrogenase/glutarate-semialdehyde dehydrogenase
VSSGEVLVAEMFIGGRRAPFERLPRIDVFDPATRQVVDTVPSADADAINVAVKAADEAFEGWSATPAAQRGEILFAAARAVSEQVSDLAPTLTSEQGKPLREARIEIKRFVHTIEHYGGLAKNLRGGYVPALDEGTYGMILRRPIGVVGAIVPWNFPTTLLANKLGPALVAGNCVVAKPAETTPLTTLRIAELMAEAGLPAGVFNVVTGDGPGAGQALVAHPRVGKVAFTGSTETGKRIMSLAGEGIKRLTLELGGSDPMIVCDDADIDRAVSAASVGRFFNCGQACLAVKRLYLFEAIADDFIDKLVEKVSRLQLGPGSAEGTMIGPMHTEEGRELLEAQVADAADTGAKVLFGGQRPQGKPYENGFFYEPTLLLEPPPDSRVATEEVFGPALPIWTVRGLDDAIARANDSNFGLGSSIWTHDLDRASHAAERIEAGYTWVNSPQKIYDELPFGGLKQSGFGKEHGIEALDYYLETKSVVVRTAV